MKQIFADTFYWIALINQRDNWHNKAIKITANLDNVEIITTDEILIEVLNFLANHGTQMRKRTIQFIKDIMSNPNIIVIAQTRESFQKGLDLYNKRLDKEYSLTDCFSMETMKQCKITEILTHDKHFIQEGFTILFQDKQ